jgi:large subunit ribosomal protein L13
MTMADKKKPGEETAKPKAKATGADDKPVTKKTAGAKAEAAPKEKKAKKEGTGNMRLPLLPRTYVAKEGEHNQGWKLVDVTDQPLGRISSYIALLLMGKTKPQYTPFIDTGDHVVVINAEKVKLTGNKLHAKVYNWHTNYPGGIKEVSVQELMDKHPERIIEKAVYRMLPKSKGHMARSWFKKLRVYKGAEHPHKAQEPQPVKIPNIGRWD